MTDSAKRIANDPYGIHEALDRAHVLMDTYHSYVVEHPAVEQRLDIAELADKAMDAMMAVYQALGRLSNEDPGNARPRTDKFPGEATEAMKAINFAVDRCAPDETAAFLTDWRGGFPNGIWYGWAKAAMQAASDPREGDDGTSGPRIPGNE